MSIAPGATISFRHPWIMNGSQFLRLFHAGTRKVGYDETRWTTTFSVSARPTRKLYDATRDSLREISGSGALDALFFKRSIRIAIYSKTRSNWGNSTCLVININGNASFWRNARAVKMLYILIVPTPIIFTPSMLVCCFSSFSGHGEEEITKTYKVIEASILQACVRSAWNAVQTFQLLPTPRTTPEE